MRLNVCPSGRPLKGGNRSRGFPLAAEVRRGALGIEFGSRLRGLVELTKLTFTIASHFQEGLEELDGLLLRVRLQQSEAADHLSRLGEGTIGYFELIAVPTHPRALGAGQAPLRSKQGAGLGPFLDKLSHSCHFLHRGRKACFRVLVD